MKRKKILFLAFVLCLMSGFLAPACPAGRPALAEEEKIELIFFYSSGCHFCAEEKEFLTELEQSYPQIEIHSLNVSQKENSSLLQRLYQKYEVPRGFWGGVPITFIKDRYFLGFDQEIGEEIRAYISSNALPSREPTGTEQPKTIRLPILGEIGISGFSPLFLAIVLGTLDGFNACAMVALVFLLTVLVSAGLRKRVFLIGGTFIFVSGLVYFLFISAWLNLFLCLSHIKFITSLIGIIIAIFGAFLFKDYLQGIVCRLCQIKKEKKSIINGFHRRLFLKMEAASRIEMPLALALVGVAIVAAGVNMVDLCCSLGFPLAFTKALTSQNLAGVSYYFYLLVYISFYMLDDLLIFCFSVLTLRITQASQKYLKAIKLVSALLLLGLGLTMIFWPQLLM